MNVHRKAQELVRTVARAFYPDEYVAVLDMLTIEPYLTKEEFAPRLRMGNKALDAILANLHQKDGLIRCQELTMNEMGGMQCYYIDYQYFANIVRYRVYMMQKKIRAMEKDQSSWRCPNCNRAYTAYEAMKLKTRDNKRACSNCSVDNFKDIDCDPQYQLEEVDRGSSIQSTNEMEAKLDTQLKSKMQYRQGIFDLLQELRDVPLHRNVPSDNMEHGLRTSAVADEATQARIDKNYQDARGTSSRATKRARIIEGALDKGGADVKIEFTNQVSKVSYMSGISSSSASHRSSERETNVPDHLQGSRVQGGHEVFEEARVLGDMSINVGSATVLPSLPQTTTLSSSSTSIKDTDVLSAPAEDEWED